MKYDKCCGNCKHFWLLDEGYDYSEDECGSCKANNGEIVYADDEECCDFDWADHFKFA